MNKFHSHLKVKSSVILLLVKAERKFVSFLGVYIIIIINSNGC